MFEQDALVEDVEGAVVSVGVVIGIVPTLPVGMGPNVRFCAGPAAVQTLGEPHALRGTVGRLAELA